MKVGLVDLFIRINRERLHLKMNLQNKYYFSTMDVAHRKEFLLILKLKRNLITRRPIVLTGTYFSLPQLFWLTIWRANCSKAGRSSSKPTRIIEIFCKILCQAEIAIHFSKQNHSTFARYIAAFGFEFAESKLQESDISKIGNIDIQVGDWGRHGQSASYISGETFSAHNNVTGSLMIYHGHLMPNF